MLGGSMFSPQGDVWLGHVPWNNSYAHVYWEGARNKQLILDSFMTMHTTNYTYIRENTDIRVPYNADSLYGINYCMYQNDGMWFCAFVNTITYKSNNTALLHLEEDIWHTWGGALNIKSCLVAREHVNSDTLGKWRAPEPAMELESFDISSSPFSTNNTAIVVGTNAIPVLKNGVSGDIFSSHTESDFDGSEAVSGGRYNNIYSGVAYYGFFVNEDYLLSNFLDNLNMCGAAESICALFMVDPSSLVVNAAHRVMSYGVNETGTIVAPRIHGNGYVPRNNKCLTYPYAYVTITDYSGGNMDLKYEDCNTWGQVEYSIEGGLDPTCQMFFKLHNYMGNIVSFEHVMPLSEYARCAWVYASYQNWAAQNSENITVKNAVSGIKLGLGLGMTAIGGALLFTGGGTPIGAALSSAGIEVSAGAAAGMALGGMGSALSGGEQLASIGAEIKYQEKHPNHVVGGSSSNSLQGVGRNSGGYVCHGLQYQSAVRLDNFFDVFGYQIDQLKEPNITGRPCWNYVKTVGACMDGNIPSDRLAKMNSCLDRGITFWHNTDVGEYAQDNSL